jgi:hypothetical protein
MLPLEIGGQKVPWSNPSIPALFVVAALLLGLFVVAETRWAREPIFPLRLLKNPQVLLGYFVTGCVLAAQGGVSLPREHCAEAELTSRSILDGIHGALYNATSQPTTSRQYQRRSRLATIRRGGAQVPWKYV